MRQIVTDLVPKPRFYPQTPVWNGPSSKLPFQHDVAQMDFGLRVSSLTVGRSNMMGSSSVGRLKGVLVNKSVEIIGLELTFCTFSLGQHLTCFDNAGESKRQNNNDVDGNKFNHVLAPFDLSCSLVVNKSGGLDDDCPQYSLNAESTTMVMAFDEVILQQMLVLSDYLSTCDLRKKYGRYRPWSCPISRKFKGWQMAWWKYAIVSILSDVRKKFKKTSWRYAAKRMICHQKYVNLYKIKLGYLRQDQPVDEAVLQELEQMEKDSDIEDILSYRSIAEYETQEYLYKSPMHNGGPGGASNNLEKSQSDSRMSGRSRGWLNWLSRGMLGAGGTDDSRQFSGVVSDEVVKDIYEATRFQPEPFTNKDAAANGKPFLAAIKCSINQISATLRNRKLTHDILQVISHGVFSHCKIWEECSSIIASINSIEVVKPCSQKKILFNPLCDAEKPQSEYEPCLSVQVDVSLHNTDVIFTAKVVVQPLEVVYDAELLLQVMDIYKCVDSFQSLSKRVLSSFNRMSSVDARLSSKVIYILSSRNNIKWDICFTSVVLRIPCRAVTGEPCTMVLESGAINLVSRHRVTALSPDIENHLLELESSVRTAFNNDHSVDFDPLDLYGMSELQMNNFEVKLFRHSQNLSVSVLEKLSFSLTITSCIIQDESYLKQFEVCIHLSSLHVHFSPTICGPLLGVVLEMSDLFSESEHSISQPCGVLEVRYHELQQPKGPHFSVDVHGGLINVYMDLENSKDTLRLNIPLLEMRYQVKDCEVFWIAAKTMEMSFFKLGETKVNTLLFSTGRMVNAHANEKVVELPCQMDASARSPADGSFCICYETVNADKSAHYRCKLYLKDAELHVEPYFYGQLAICFKRINAMCISYAKEVASRTSMMDNKPIKSFHYMTKNADDPESVLSGQLDISNCPLDRFPLSILRNLSMLATSESLLSCSDSVQNKISNMGFVSKNIDALSFMGGLYVLNINLSGMQIHVHDSSSVIVTATIPYSVSSVCIQNNVVDVICSIDALSISSSWWTSRLQNDLWGPLSSTVSPVLKIRFRTSEFGQVSKTDICISVQNVSAVLPTELLAVMIGYFTLSDWNAGSNVEFLNEDQDKMEAIWFFTYNIEILDSSLIIPVESAENQYLKLDIPMMHCRFIPLLVLADPLENIPSECSVKIDKAAESNYSLNLFGRHLSLSYILLQDLSSCRSLPKEMKWPSKVSLISPFCADVWVLIPHHYTSSCAFDSGYGNLCVMARVLECKILVEGASTLEGIGALIFVIDQFLAVDEDSKYFESDILKFLESKRNVKEKTAGSAAADTINTELQICISSMTCELFHFEANTITFKPVAKLDTQFVFAASFEDEIPSKLDFSFSSLSLLSLQNSVLLLQFNSPSPDLPAFQISFSRSENNPDEVFFLFPVLELWFHFPSWDEIIRLCHSYIENITNTNYTGVSDKKQNVAPTDQIVNFDHVIFTHTSDSLIALDETINPLAIHAHSDSIGIKIHFPLFVAQEASNVSSEAIHSYIKCSKSLTVAAYCRGCELVMNGSNTKVMLMLDNISGDIEISDENTLQTWPFFRVYGTVVTVETLIGLQLSNIKFAILSDAIDVWLSYQVFHFWSGTTFPVPKAQSSPDTLTNIHLEAQLSKASLQLTDDRWSCNGPLFEILLKNLVLCSSTSGATSEVSITCDLQVNYNNIHKVVWEPLVELSKFHVKIIRKGESDVLVDSGKTIDICIESTTQVNLNFTETAFEAIWRAVATIKDASRLTDKNVDHTIQDLEFHQMGKHSLGTYAPYIIQNLTSVPLMFHVYLDVDNLGEYNNPVKVDGYTVKPGSSVPVYVNNTSKKQFASTSSQSFDSSQSNLANHHYMTIQFDGTSLTSVPISMDLVGLTYFEVDFSKGVEIPVPQNDGVNSIYSKSNQEQSRGDPSKGCSTPVVVDITVMRCSKLIRLYSTVVLFNATSMPLELRFDIPFGLSHKIQDPVNPGHEFPLPLHLSEAGRVSWRPWGETYLWSAPQNISNFRTGEGRIGFFRSFICYPPLPSIDPFRCCISVHDINISPSDSRSKQLHMKKGGKHLVEQRLQSHSYSEKSIKQSIHYVVISTPLTVKNYLPEPISLTILSSGVARTVKLSEVETSFYHIDSLYDVDMVFDMQGSRSSLVKFPRMDTFSLTASFDGTNYFMCETATFDSNKIGSVTMNVEMLMNNSGAREVSIFVPFLLYNCTRLSLILTDSLTENIERIYPIPSCYDSLEEGLCYRTQSGLGLVPDVMDNKHDVSSSIASCIISTRVCPDRSLLSCRSSRKVVSSDMLGTDDLRVSSDLTHSCSISKCQFIWKNECEKHLDIKGKPSMYFPNSNPSMSEIFVRVSSCAPECGEDNIPHSSWSSPICLSHPSDPTCVVIPHQSPNGAYVVSVTCSAIAGPTVERTKIITLQPRYVICNACSKDLCYKQKGTDIVSYLGVGEHAHLNWADIRRDLLVSIRFGEPGWQWSGSFLPERLGDTQVKMWNYVSGTQSIVRVEVQNADVSPRDGKIFESPHGNSGTNLILISDDDTGFMPYRIDNFTNQRIRVYQQQCETFETVVHSYSSCSYAWDEPSYPHRLTVEVPGKGLLGSYTLDDVKEYSPIMLGTDFGTSENKFLVAVHAEGAIKVLSVIDSSHHNLTDMRGSSVPWYRKQEIQNQQNAKPLHCKERLSVYIQSIGISFIDSFSEELLFVSAKSISMELLQSVDQHNFSFQISSLQIDNQLHTTPYPVVLSFDEEYKNDIGDHLVIKDHCIDESSDSIVCQPVLCLDIAKWRSDDIGLVSVQRVNLRIADFHLEIDEEVLLRLFCWCRMIYSRVQNQIIYDSSHSSVNHDADLQSNLFTHIETHRNLESRMKEEQSVTSYIPILAESWSKSSPSFLSVTPIGAPWQKLYLLAAKQKKVYVELFEVTPVNLTLSFSSTPWKLRHGSLALGESLVHRGFTALADIEGAKIKLKQLLIEQHLASWESLQANLIRHYTRQLQHEMYKVLASAGVIGNPMGFARSVGLGIKDFLAVPASSLKNPRGIVTGLAHGTTSLVRSTVYALSDAASQITKSAHKGIVALDNQCVTRSEVQEKGVINEILQGLTGLLQSPVKEAEKHGLPGVLSGVVFGVTGLVLRPAASILEVTGKTAQSIRKRSKVHQTSMQRLRARLPRLLIEELPLRPYSWEDAVGMNVLVEAAGGMKMKDDILVVCKALKQGGKYVIITETRMLIVSCSSLVGVGKPGFRGVPPDPEWVIEAEVGLDSVVHADADGALLHIVGSSSHSDPITRQKRNRGASQSWGNSSFPLPISQTNVELESAEDAERLLQTLLGTIELGKEQGWGRRHILHKSNVR
uniref:Vacuolar protein sorting-associated protein 13 VPS13 adaptor binding domain-containing protein n=1 Tax=Kalanchoe fedtschenkoi TaxID=63787 RepID=A0A7N0U003_KALFE